MKSVDGLRLSHLPGTPLPSRPRRPLAVRIRGWLLDHGRLVTAAVAIGLVLAGVVEAVGR